MEVAVENKLRYDKYKDSGMEWLGEIPEHWEVKRFKHVFNEKKKVANIDLNCGSISFGKIVYKNDEKIPESTKRSYQVLLKGEFLINPLNLNYDLISLRIALSDKDVVVSSGYIIINNVVEINKEYYKWLLHIFDVAYMKTLGSGVRQTLSFTHIANSEIVFPPLFEQQAIAHFLDDKCSKIDAAVEIKQKQITLLKERRQIAIHQAVTRGLDKNVPLKDSGVEWIGAIPAHWEVEPIKYSLNGIIDCEHKTAPFVDEEKYFVVRTSNVKDGKLTFNNAKYTHHKGFLEWTERGVPLPGDILLTREAPAGEACLVPRNVYLCLGQRMVWLKVDKTRLIPQLGIYFIYSSIGRTYIDYLSSGSTVLHFNMADIKNIPIINMPIEEQKEIVSFLDSGIQKIETAISLKQEEIEKLKEYKTSLINSAVTGKIKMPEVN